MSARSYKCAKWRHTECKGDCACPCHEPGWVSERGPVSDRLIAGSRLAENGCREWLGTTRNGYGSIRVKGRKESAHRVAWQEVNGRIPPGLQLDHLCHNALCINVDHLRAVTQSVNQHNRLKANSNSKTGVRGVSPAGSRFQAQIKIDRKVIYLGVFKTVEEAETAVRRAQKETAP